MRQSILPLIPILGLSQEMVPAISIILVLITVVYTTMGGLKAVVMTDVLQTAVMFVGVILAIVVIGWKVGSVDAFLNPALFAHWGVRRFFYRCNEKNDCREYLYYDIGLAGLYGRVGSDGDSTVSGN